MDQQGGLFAKVIDGYNDIFKNADPRVENMFLMDSPVPSFIICTAYILFVLAGPTIMKDRKPVEMRSLLLVYNLFMVALSSYTFYEFLMSGWLTGYSLGCQPVDYSNSPQALRAMIMWKDTLQDCARTGIKGCSRGWFICLIIYASVLIPPQMVRVCWLFYISKFIELFDTVFFILRKKFNQVSFLHVFHHGIMPVSWWFGVKLVPGGFGTFHSLLNSFIHLTMYTYYGLAALGPAFHKYLWWKKYMTSMQITQFVSVMIHSSQLLFIECDYPIFFVYWIGFYALIFFIMFAHFYIQAYLKPKSMEPRKPQTTNGSIADKQKSKSS